MQARIMAWTSVVGWSRQLADVLHWHSIAAMHVADGDVADFLADMNIVHVPHPQLLLDKQVGPSILSTTCSHCKPVHEPTKS